MFSRSVWPQNASHQVIKARLTSGFWASPFFKVWHQNSALSFIESRLHELRMGQECESKYYGHFFQTASKTTEIWTSLDFEWSKRGRVANGPNFEWI